MTRYTRFGPGDPITWPPCTGHPGDPRTDDHFSPEEDEEPEEDDDLGDYDEDQDFDEFDHEPSSN
jgi:hypothetical protein